jgi:hypothetical protein
VNVGIVHELARLQQELLDLPVDGLVGGDADPEGPKK